MNIVFDMDNTLADEVGATKRPGIDQLLAKLQSEGHTLSLWTNSTRERARTILRDHDLMRYFNSSIFREDYDPDSKGIGKDIRTINGDLLVDDDPKQIEYVKSIKKKGVLVKAYRKDMKIADTKKIYEAIRSQQALIYRILGR